MLNANWKKATAGLFAGCLSVAMAPMPDAPAPVAHFINDQGELVSVDPPEAGRQPLFVAIPVGPQAKAPVQQNEKTSANR